MTVDHELLHDLVAELEQRLTQASVHDWKLRQRLLGALVVLQARWARARWLLEGRSRGQPTLRTATQSSKSYRVGTCMCNI